MIERGVGRHETCVPGTGMFENRGVWPAALWMFGLSILLSWLPIIGPGIAGFVGGFQAGAIRPALVAAAIPSLVVAAIVWLVGWVFDLALLGAFVGIGVFVVLLIGTLPLLVGAAIGGAASERRRL